MSLTDPVRIERLAKRGSFILSQGRETFYDNDHAMIEFASVKEAVEWAVKNLGKNPSTPGLEKEQKKLWPER